MNKVFFTEYQHKQLQEAMDNCPQIISQNNIYAIPKSNKTIIEDLYRAIIRNIDHPNHILSASSGGWKVIVEKNNNSLNDFSVKIEKNSEENYAWTLSKTS
jgi:hypothetical protein